MIYTSYFAKLRCIPKNIVPISIAAKTPDWYSGLTYKKLAPKYQFFMEWKKTRDNRYYIEHFNNEVLKVLNPYDVINDFKSMTNNANDIVLLCYETPDKFCHRHLVAGWLNAAGYEVIEWSEHKIFQQLEVII